MIGPTSDKERKLQAKKQQSSLPSSFIDNMNQTGTKRKEKREENE